MFAVVGSYFWGSEHCMSQAVTSVLLQCGVGMVSIGGQGFKRFCIYDELWEARGYDTLKKKRSIRTVRKPR